MYGKCTQTNLRAKFTEQQITHDTVQQCTIQHIHTL